MLQMDTIETGREAVNTLRERAEWMISDNELDDLLCESTADSRTVTVGFSEETETYLYKQGLEYRYSEGVDFFIEACGADWLLEKIFMCVPCVPGLDQELFIFWDITKNEAGQGAILACKNADNSALYAETIIHTALPLKAIRFVFHKNTLFLPSEQ